MTYLGQYGTLPSPTKTGYKFEGWYTAESGGTKVTSTTQVTTAGDRTLYAKWTIVTYTITCDLKGGTLSADEKNPTEYTVQSAAITLNNPTRTGYTFTGWSGTGLSSIIKNVTIAKGSTGNRSYTANWTANTYNVTLKVNGGRGGTSLTSYTYDKGATLPTNWTKTGYTFGGWYDNPSFTGNSVTSIGKTATGDKTYYAKWIAGSYTVSYEYQGATGGKTQTSKQVTYLGQYGTLPSPTKTGYKFEGWYTAESGGTKVTSTTQVTTAGDHKLYAKWTIVTYTITCDLKGGTLSADEKNPTEYTVQSAAITLNNPTRTGYTFTGWSGTGLSSIIKDVTIAKGSTGDRSYTANWKANTYNVTLEVNGGRGGTSLTSYTYDKGATLPTNWTKTGYTFGGWYDNPSFTGNSVTSIGKTATGDKTYYAKWIADSYTISYTLNGGTVTGNPEDYTIESAAITLNNPTRTGYTFTGWSGTGLSSITKNVTIAKGSTGNRSYTANWTANTYNVTLKVNGGRGGTSLTSYTYDKGATLSTNWTKTGYTFGGWYDNPGFTGNSVTSIGKTATGDKTYYAKWIADNYTISYTLNGGTVTGNPEDYTIESDAITLNNPTRTGYTFTGWSGTGLSGDSNTSVTIAKGSTGDRSYTANWTVDTYTITCDLNGGTLSADEKNPTDYTIESDAIALNNPTRTGYTFKGWSGTDLSGESNKSVTIAKGSTGDRNYTANWKAKTYNVTLEVNGGRGGTSLTSYTYDKGATLPTDWTKTGYTFGGWYDNEELTGTKVTKISASATGVKAYYAKWEPISYSITYDLDEGTATGNPKAYTIESNAITLKNPTRTGYTFKGWSGTDLSGESNKNVTIEKESTGNRSYTAHWTVDTYTITCDLNGGTLSADEKNPTDYTVESDAITLNNPTRTGYTFTGWSGTDLTGDSNKNVTIAKGSTEDRSYTAHWTPNSYTVSFAYQGATGSPETKQVTYDSAYSTLPEPARTGYTFKGWYTEANGAGSKITDETIVKAAKNHTLYVYWKDETAPDAPILQSDVTLQADWTNAQTTIPLLLKDGVAVTELWVSVDDGSYTKVGGFTGVTGSTKYSYPVTEGEHTYKFKAKDEAGNTSEESEAFTVRLDTANPEFGELTYENKAANLWQWIIGKKSMIIHVSVTDTDRNEHAGSGVKQITYTMTPMDSDGNADSDNVVTKKTAVTDGQAKITFSENFKGTIAISCTDAAGNAASGITVGTNGVIVEDAAPIITSDVQEGYYDAAPELTVTVKDDKDNAITAGIASITYQIGDAAKEVSVDTSALQAGVSFPIPASEIPTGVTAITVKAKDHAGNEASEAITVKVKKPEKQPAAAINYQTEKLTGLVPDGDYTVNGTAYRADADGCIDLDESWLNTTIDVVRKGNGCEIGDSATQSISIPSRPSAPSSLPELADRTDSSITLKEIDGVQYRINDGGWQESPEFTGLSEKTVYTFTVYYPATEDTFASEESSTVSIATLPSTPGQGTFLIDYTEETLTLEDGVEAFADEACTIPVPSGGVEDYIGQPIYIRYAADGEIPESAVTAVTIPPRPSAPTAGTQNASYPGAKDGKLTGLAEGGSYEIRGKDGNGDWGEWTDAVLTGTEIQELAAGEYEVRIKAAEGESLKSEALAVTVGENPATKEETPDIQIDYRQETLTGFTPGKEYIITVNGNTVAVTAGTDGILKLEEEWIGTTLSIVKRGNGKNKLDSEAQSLTVPQRPEKPTPSVVAESKPDVDDGKLTGLEAGMNYQISTDNGAAWKSVTADENGEITNLVPGSYIVRVSSTDSGFASKPSAGVSIAACRIYMVTLHENGGSGTALTFYTIGEGAVLPADWTRTGYTFAGWYDNEKCTGNAVTNISTAATGDKEYWAKWKAVSYTITYALDGGRANGNPKSYTIESDSITLNNPEKEGYTFTGWSGTDLTNNDNKSVTIAAGSTGDRTYTAHWKKNMEDDSNDGSDDTTDNSDNTTDNSGNTTDNSDNTTDNSDNTTDNSDNTTDDSDIQDASDNKAQRETLIVPDDKPDDRKERQDANNRIPKGRKVQTIQASIDGGKFKIFGGEVTTGNIAEAQETTTVLETGDGAVIVRVVCEDEKQEAGVRDTVAVANAVLTSEQIQLVNDGETIEIRVDVKDISKTVPGQDKEAIEGGLTECQKEMPDLTLGMYVDISMFVKVGGGDWNTVTSTEEPIEVLLSIPEELRGDGREFYIIRSHDGEYTILNDIDDNPNTITVSTNLFSAYAIAYEHAEATGESGAKCGLCHICPTFLGICCFIWLAILVAIFLIIWLIIRRNSKKRKEQEKFNQI